jgi:two-component system chemotaxis response regulator CheY
MDESRNHLAYNCELADIDAVIVDESRFVQTLMRTILLPLRFKRIRFYNTAKDALDDILHDPPNLLITDWRVVDSAGRPLAKVLRHKQMGSAACMPILVTMAHPTRRDAEKAFRYGVQAILAKPFSQNALQKRIQWILKDRRPMTLASEHFIIEGLTAVLCEKLGVSRSQQDYKVISDEEADKKLQVQVQAA